MGYLDEFELLIDDGMLAEFMRLWEEYCLSDHVDGEELVKILEHVKGSAVATLFGPFAESVLHIWNKIEDPKIAGDVLRLALDLQTTDSPLVADLATQFLQKSYGSDPHFNQKLRIVGLLARRSFQGAISNFELLTHMDKGKFVFHTGGWGVGEVMDISLLREHVVLEFEGIATLKDLSFTNAFKHLVPISSEHFLAKRFGEPDKLEKEGKEDSVELVRLLLKDLGPKTAQEIKDELCELVIPQEDWIKWWGATRTKLKKDTHIQPPKTAKQRFILRDEALSHDSRMLSVLSAAQEIDAKIQIIYNFTRDFPEILKNDDLKEDLKSILTEEGLVDDPKYPDNSLARRLQCSFLLEDIFPTEFPSASAELVLSMETFEPVLNCIDIVAFKKRLFTTIREKRKDWETIFLYLLFPTPLNSLRDYLFKELQQNLTAAPLLHEKIHTLLHKVTLYPEAFFWYFQKLAEKEDVPFANREDCYLFFEAYLVLIHFLETKFDEYRDLVKKMHQLLTVKRYLVVRNMIEGAPVDYLREILLLTSKCQCFTKHDLKIFQNLAEVVQPSLAKKKREKAEVIWATPEGYKRVQEQIQRIGTVDIIDNAREIEAARAHGDLRENSEYKFALERRSRLQSQLKSLTEQLNKARILSKSDITTDRVGVGTVVKLVNEEGKKQTYTLLGPWDADPDKNILSLQSKMAEAMLGRSVNESFDFLEHKYTIESIESFL